MELALDIFLGPGLHNPYSVEQEATVLSNEEEGDLEITPKSSRIHAVSWQVG